MLATNINHYSRLAYDDSSPEFCFRAVYCCEGMIQNQFLLGEHVAHVYPLATFLKDLFDQHVEKVILKASRPLKKKKHAFLMCLQHMLMIQFDQQMFEHLLEISNFCQLSTLSLGTKLGTSC